METNPAADASALQLKETSQGVTMPVKAHAASKRPGFPGIHSGSLRVAVSAVAADGKANVAILRALADALGTPLANVRLLRGATSTNKLVAISDISADEIRTRIQFALAKSASP